MTLDQEDALTAMHALQLDVPAASSGLLPSHLIALSINVPATNILASPPVSIVFETLAGIVDALLEEQLYQCLPSH